MVSIPSEDIRAGETAAAEAATAREWRDAGPRRGEEPKSTACRIVSALEDSVLRIQGPPGAGKTFTGARMICELVKEGKKIGLRR